jgi:hypothetical protein
MPPGEDDADRTPPTGPQALEHAAADRDPNPGTQAAALAYFMGDEPPPGRDTPIPLEVDFGAPGHPNFQRCVFRTLANEELVKCEELAQVKNSEGIVERIDPFTRWSYVFAYACREPDLAQALEARRAKGEEHPDTASVVREVFRFQPGVLKNAAFVIEDRSRHADDKERTVREIEAGKGSS